MAPDATSLAPLDPKEALAALSGLHDYRERLTAQAAGIVWMAWGLVLAFVGLVSLYTNDHNRLDGHKEAAILLWLVAVAAGGFLTNAVWRAHALEREHPAWVPYVAGAVAVTLVVLFQEAVNWILHEGLHTGLGSAPLGFASFNLLPAVGAATLAWLQRKRVPGTPGWMAAVGFLALYLVGSFAPWPGGDPTNVYASCAWIGLGLAGFLAVGLTTWSKG